MAGTLRLLVTASRDWADPLRMWNVLDGYLNWATGMGMTLVIVHGDAAGGDQIAKLFGELHGPAATQESHPADWHAPCEDRCQPGHRRTRKNGGRYCPMAGNYRNERMVGLGAERGVAFIRAGSGGASNCARLMERAGIPTRRYTSD